MHTEWGLILGSDRTTKMSKTLIEVFEEAGLLDDDMEKNSDSFKMWCPKCHTEYSIHVNNTDPICRCGEGLDFERKKPKGERGSDGNEKLDKQKKGFG